MVLPLFLLAMIAALQYCCAMEAAVKYGTALAETGESLASTAYLTTYVEGQGEGLLAKGFSLACAEQEVRAKAGKNGSVRNLSMVSSLLLQEDDMVDLVLTYQIRSPVAMISLPGTTFVQRASVRAWTGRSEEETSGTGEKDGQMVLVTETGSVYHTNPDCTHLKLSISTADLTSIGELRNDNGAKYYPCEKCGEGCAGTVFITREGNRYHSSSGCSGLKRTVTQVPLSEVGDMRLCSRCGKAM